MAGRGAGGESAGDGAGADLLSLRGAGYADVADGGERGGLDLGMSVRGAGV